MERLGLLIHKLKQQFELGADIFFLKATLVQLQSELEKHEMQIQGGLVQTATYGASLAAKKITTKIAVILPSQSPISAMRLQLEPNIPVQELYKNENTVKPEEKIVYELEGHFGEEPEVIEEESTIISLKPIENIETKKQPETSEWNEKFKAIQDSDSTYVSVNDRLMNQTQETIPQLKNSGIKDLKQAIGINDRYLFINELFRGDEIMYDRSIKTINGFTSYAEAEYWISRELKIKLGWKQKDETVNIFDQLVKRRFS